MRSTLHVALSCVCTAALALSLLLNFLQMARTADLEAELTATAKLVGSGCIHEYKRLSQNNVYMEKRLQELEQQLGARK